MHFLSTSFVSFEVGPPLITSHGGCAVPRVRLGARALAQFPFRCGGYGVRPSPAQPRTPLGAEGGGTGGGGKTVQLLPTRLRLCSFYVSSRSSTPNPNRRRGLGWVTAEQYSDDKGGGPTVADGERAKAWGGRIAGMRSDPFAPGFPRESSLVGISEHGRLAAPP